MNLADLEKNLGATFKDRKLLRQALTHRSYLNEHPNEKTISNERLEFLGDAILEFVVSEILFQQFPKVNEGVLTALRSRVVCTQSLAQISLKLETGQFLYLSRGEEKEGGRKNPTLLANVLEALIGAVFQEGGIEAASAFIQKHFQESISQLSSKNLKDCKSLFQEKTQETEKITPVYRVLKEKGPDHAKTFTVGVFVGKRKAGQGQGRSKQEAQEAAAKMALERNEQN